MTNLPSRRASVGKAFVGAALIPLWLALAASAAPTLSLESVARRGEARQSFTTAETPVVAVDFNDRFYAALKVVRTSDGTTLWRLALADFYGADPDLGLTADEYVDNVRHSTSAMFPESGNRRVTLPRLPAGDYAVELWLRGVRVSSTPLQATPAVGSPAAFPALPVAPMRPFPGGSPERAVNREVAALLAVVGLDARQQHAARAIYVAAYKALPRSVGEPPFWREDAEAVRSQVAPQIRALLTSAQRRLLDDDGSAFQASLRTNYPGTETTPTGGAAQAPEEAARHRVERLDQLVQLTTAQRDQAFQLFALEAQALENFATLAERAEKGMPVRQRTRTEIRALLTPEQQRRYDAAPQRLGGGATRDPENQALQGFLIHFLKHTPALIQRTGAVARVTLQTGNTMQSESKGAPTALTGCYRYVVEGQERSEAVEVWFERSTSGEIRVLKIEAGGHPVTL